MGDRKFREVALLGIRNEEEKIQTQARHSCGRKHPEVLNPKT